ncbi:MAG: hypothetical protein AAF901_03155 [Bacteroidota bacterium]
MKTTTNKALSCAVFGHNFFKSKTFDDGTTELTCSHCQTKITTDKNGNFEESSIGNVNMQTAIRQLFLLKWKLGRTITSS